MKEMEVGVNVRRTVAASEFLDEAQVAAFVREVAKDIHRIKKGKSIVVGATIAWRRFACGLERLKDGSFEALVGLEREVEEAFPVDPADDVAFRRTR